MTKGLAQATVVEPWSRVDNSEWKDLADFSGTLFSTDFEPNIGVIAASNEYWSGLSERERQAWKRALDEATLNSSSEINKNDAVARAFSKIKPIAIMEKDRYKLIVNYSSAAPEVANELKVMEAARARIQTGEALKKKK